MFVLPPHMNINGDSFVKLYYKPRLNLKISYIIMKKYTVKFDKNGQKTSKKRIQSENWRDLL